ncbi:MAG TPA: prolyl-tRNA synthetase associated domain-containing protein [Bacteroidales bacterium]|nr:prolyl-tRNA synthetase associated domain-containing protein [Bacteroidales bacterium]HPS15898.1 prolyl-tRNA synthetase associated domain-containing protein [Bacteroidales bacterium]
MNSFRGDTRVYEVLNKLEIPFEYYEHPPVPTVKEAAIYWKDLKATHCKNLFFRNHKGNKHYLVIFEYSHNIQIHDLEQRLKQGKLTFASNERLMKYLGLTPGSVSPFGLLNDISKHVHLFLDENFKCSEKISFHPNLNTASLVIPFSGFEKFLMYSGNCFEYVKLYD